MTSTADNEIARLRAQLEQRDHCIASFQSATAKLNEKIFNLLMANQELECTLRAKDEELAEQSARLAAVTARLSAKDACIEAYQHAGEKANEKIFNLLMANQELTNTLSIKEDELAKQTHAVVASECAAAAKDACIEAFQHAGEKANEKIFNLLMANQELECTLRAKEEEAAAEASKLACAEAHLSAKDACIEAYQHATTSLNAKLWNAHMTAQELEAAVERASASASAPAPAAPAPSSVAPSSVAADLAEARQAYFGAYVMLMKTNLFAAGVTFTATQQEVIDKAMLEGVSVGDFPKWTSRFFQKQ